MKLGKSILLDELLKADDVEYTDVSQNRFWIVCPACNEAIFKVVRNQGTKENSALHYFSHYEASKAYAADCELRVGRITEREITEKAIQSRDQKLQFFINTLQTIIHQDFRRHMPADPRWTSNQFRVMTRSRTIADLRSAFYDAFFLKTIPESSDKALLSAFDLAFSRLPQSERNQLSTTLSLHTQKRIAIDLLRHLHTPQALPSLDTLFDHSFAWYARRLENASRNAKLLGLRTHNNDEEEIFKTMLRIMTTSRGKLRPILSKLAQNQYGTTGPDGPDNSLLTMFDGILRESFVILIRLPYLSLLRESLKQQSVTSKALWLVSS